MNGDRFRYWKVEIFTKRGIDEFIEPDIIEARGSSAAQ